MIMELLFLRTACMHICMRTVRRASGHVTHLARPCHRWPRRSAPGASRSPGRAARPVRMRRRPRRRSGPRWRRAPAWRATGCRTAAGICAPRRAARGSRLYLFKVNGLVNASSRGLCCAIEPQRMDRLTLVRVARLGHAGRFLLVSKFGIKYDKRLGMSERNPSATAKQRPKVEMEEELALALGMPISLMDTSPPTLE